MVPTLDVPTPHAVAALVYPSLGELAALLPDTPEAHRFLAKVEVGPVPEHAPHLGPCLMWTRAVTSQGYGAFKTSHDSLYPGVGRRTVSAHAWLDFHLNGPLPAGLELDHICHEANLCTAPPLSDPHRLCVLHTVRCTPRQNWLRGRSFQAINAAKLRCEGSEVEPDPITGEKVGHLLTDEQGRDTENVYRAPDGSRKCRPCQRSRDARWKAKARRLKAAARQRGLREAGQLELLAG